MILPNNQRQYYYHLPDEIKHISDMQIYTCTFGGSRVIDGSAMRTRT